MLSLAQPVVPLLTKTSVLLATGKMNRQLHYISLTLLTMKVSW